MIDLQHLPGSTPDEKTVALLRRHWTSLVSLGISFIFILILPVGTFFAVGYAVPEFFDDPVRTTLFVLGLSTFFLYAWLFLYQHYIDYHLDLWIVTDNRILNIEQHGLFARTVAELRLHRIQDVTAEVHGFLHTMLDYGNVYIQTAGETQRFQFEDIPHPNQIAKLVLDLAEKNRQEELGEAVEEFQNGSG
ncbi:MAG: PH domain-containing protein [Patescibacteria group bacterium]|jgi:uncharacterized membrane protein YdbT with pleckstrin-like domain